MRGRTGIVSVDDESNLRSQISELRLQTALARTLLDEVERLAPAAGLRHAPSAQLAEELTRLGDRLLEVGLWLARSERNERNERSESDLVGFFEACTA